MKKSFLVFGALAAILSNNSYADIVISQTDDNPDTVITVARATKVGARDTTKSSAPKGAVDIGDMAVRYVCPNECVVSLRGEQDDVNLSITTEYAKCVTKDGKSCDLPKVEIVGVVGGSTINHVGTRPNTLTQAQQAQQAWLDAGNYYDEDGNPVNVGKKKR